MKILDVRWFCGYSNVGIVRAIVDEFDGIQYFISSCVEGNNEEQDKRHIALNGSTFPIAAGDALFGIKKGSKRR